MTADRPAVGIRRKRDGWQAYIKIGGRLVTRQFPADASVAKMLRWRHEQTRPRATELVESDGSLFGEDCARYLKAVAGMTTISDRTFRINEWKRAFRGKARGELTPIAIQAQLEAWRKAGLTPATLNLRRTALSHLFTTLDRSVPGAINPVRSVPRYREEQPPLILPTLADAIRAVQGAKETRPKRGDSHHAIRLEVLLWTGWPGKLLARLREDDVDFEAGTAIVHGRSKGAGTRPRRLPLLPQALAALTSLRDAKAFGPFDNHNLRRALRRGCKAAKVKMFRVYDLRHLFGTTVAITTKDDRVVAELLMHTDTSQTRRYTESSVNPRVLAGLAAVHAALTPPTPPAPRKPRATSRRLGNLSPAGQPQTARRGSPGPLRSA